MTLAMAQRSGLRSPRKGRVKTQLRRQLITLVAVLAFAIQGFATQTHIHQLGQVDVAFFGNVLGKINIANVIAPQKAGPFKYPPSNTPANCPLCHELALAGHYVTPGATLFFLPDFLVFALAVAAHAPPFIVQLSHDWLSRGPPRA